MGGWDGKANVIFHVDFHQILQACQAMRCGGEGTYIIALQCSSHKLIIRQCSHGSFHLLMGDVTACLQCSTKVRWRLDPPPLEGCWYYQLHPCCWCVLQKHIAEVHSWPPHSTFARPHFYIPFCHENFALVLHLGKCMNYSQQGLAHLVNGAPWHHLILLSH